MLNRLAEVQTFDLQIDELGHERAQVPPELIAAQERRLELERNVEQTTQEQNDLRKAVSSNELELKSLEERRREASSFAMRAATVKEASQYQNQELQFGTRVAELEEDTLPLMEEFDAVTERLAELEGQLAELLPELAELEASEALRLEEIEQRAVQLVSQRASMAGAIEAPLLKQYEQVRKARGGRGLAEVIDNATCGGCNVRLPIHVVQKARKGVGVTRCPSCGRILWCS